MPAADEEDVDTDAGVLVMDPFDRRSWLVWMLTVRPAAALVLTSAGLRSSSPCDRPMICRLPLGPALLQPDHLVDHPLGEPLRVTERAQPRAHARGRFRPPDFPAVS